MNWKEQELDVLNKYYIEYGPKFCEQKLREMGSERSYKSILKKGFKLGYSFDTSRFYKSDEFDLIVSKSDNLSDVCKKINLNNTYGNRQTIKKYIEIKKLDVSHFYKRKRKYKSVQYSLDEILVENSPYRDTTKLKEKLYKEGLKERICEKCNQDENWKGNKISLILDHINGINNDNRIENLRILCPNCNAGLETHCGKNIKRSALNYKTRNLNFDIVRKEQYVKVDKVNNYKKDFCQCGKEKSLSSKHCKECNDKIHRKVDRPPYEQLLKEIKELGYSGTGRKYGVSDNTIRKWKKKYENKC